jgi:hypothetical protein
MRRERGKDLSRMDIALLSRRAAGLREPIGFFLAVLACMAGVGAARSPPPARDPAAAALEQQPRRRRRRHDASCAWRFPIVAVGLALLAEERAGGCSTWRGAGWLAFVVAVLVLDLASTCST